MTDLDTDRQPMERSQGLAMFCEIGIQLLRSLKSFVKEDLGGAVNLLLTLVSQRYYVSKLKAVGTLLTSCCATAAR